MSYTHLSIALRSKLEILHKQGKSYPIDCQRTRQTSCHNWPELCRKVAEHPYGAENAQEDYVQRCKASVSAGKWNPELASRIEGKLQATWSPEQIVERLRQEGQAMVSFKTVYRWLYTGHLVKGVLAVLRHKGKCRKPIETCASRSVRKRFATGKPLAIGNWIRWSRAVGEARAV